MKKNLHILALGLGLTLTACGDDDGDGKNAAEELVDAGLNLAKNMDLPGHDWSTGCNSASFLEIDALTLSAKEVWDFDNTSTDVDRKFGLYSDASCETAVGEIRFLGNYELKEENDKGLNPINLEFNKAWMKTSSSTLADALSTVSWCGIDSWSEGEDVEVTEAVKNGDCVVPESLDTKTYDVILVEDSKVYFGTPYTMAPTNEDNRPESVDKSITFNK